MDSPTGWTNQLAVGDTVLFARYPRDYKLIHEVPVTHVTKTTFTVTTANNGTWKFTRGEANEGRVYPRPKGYGWADSPVVYPVNDDNIEWLADQADQATQLAALTALIEQVRSAADDCTDIDALTQALAILKA